MILFVLYVMLVLAEWLLVRVVTVRCGGGRALFGLCGMLLPLACCSLPLVSSFSLIPSAAGYCPGRVGGTGGTGGLLPVAAACLLPFGPDTIGQSCPLNWGKGPDSPKTTPRRPPKGPGQSTERPKGGPRTAQDGPKTAQEAPKSDPRRPQTAPRRARTAPEAPNRPDSPEQNRTGQDRQTEQDRTGQTRKTGQTRQTGTKKA